MTKIIQQYNVIFQQYEPLSALWAPPASFSLQALILKVALLPQIPPLLKTTLFISLQNTLKIFWSRLVFILSRCIADKFRIFKNFSSKCAQDYSSYWFVLPSLSLWLHFHLSQSLCALFIPILDFLWDLRKPKGSILNNLNYFKNVSLHKISSWVEVMGRWNWFVYPAWKIGVHL